MVLGNMELVWQWDGVEKPSFDTMARTLRE